LTVALAAVGVGLYALSEPETKRPGADVELTPEKPLPAKTAQAEKGPAPAAAGPVLSDANSKAATGLVGAKVCAECHPGEAALQARSGHSRTLRPAAEGAVARWLDGRTVKDPEHPDATWTYDLAGGRLEVERAERGSYRCLPLDYAVGSGANGVTFVSVRRGRGGGSGTALAGVEHRLSYFASGPTLEVTPGQAKTDSASKVNQVGPHGRDLDRAELARCLNCHATALPAVSASDADPESFDPAGLVPNVSCERCHGPGADHVKAARGGAPAEALAMAMGDSDVLPVRQIRQCGECHRDPSSVSPDYVTPENNEIARFQPVGLAMSACFKDGKSGLSCTSCHDPHARAARDHAAYERVCLGCHSPVQRKSCPVSAREGCIDCHMPRRTVSGKFQFADHWIRVPEKDKAAPGR
jgi:hypothetical protein